MKSLKLLLIIHIIILALPVLRAEGADWKHYAEAVNHEIKYYFSPESVENRSENIVRVWTKVVPVSSEKKDEIIQKRNKLRLSVEGYEDYEYSLRFKEINCSDKLHSLLSYVDYSRGNSILDSYYYNTSQWSPVVPESSAEQLFLLVCPGKHK